MKAIKSIETLAESSPMIRGARYSIRGRRIKFTLGSRVVGVQGGPPEYCSRRGTVIEYLGASLYRVKFDDQEEKECVLSQWLELNEALPW